MNMKINVTYILICLLLVNLSCQDLDVVPKTGISSENFFRNEEELQIGLNALYEKNLWKVDEDFWTDDMHHRGGDGVNNDISRATLNSESGLSGAYWTDLYDGVKRANTLLSEMLKIKETVEPSAYNRIEGEARAVRAYFYSILLTKFGDVPLITGTPTVDESLDFMRTPQNEVRQFVYDELDAAVGLLESSNENRATEGFALGIKARVALYTGDYATARDAAQAVIESGTYSLDPDFRELFLKEGASSPELIYFVPQSIELNVTFSNLVTRDLIPRNAGGFGARMATWEAVDIFEAVDGLPIDESPLYDPHDPFANRDPRMAQTIVPLGTPWLGYVYQSHPDSVQTLAVNTGEIIGNNDSRGQSNFAAFTGFLWKKGIEQRWADDPRTADPNIIILRYADVLLMYAEALIELGENLAGAQDAINQVRARAYGTVVGDVANYPAVTETDQAGLRIRLRRERRVELMLEGLRYQDLIRWRIAKKALDRLLVGLPEPAEQIRSQWPFNDEILPTIDDDGVVVLDAPALIANNYARLLQDYDFDESRMYLWPIPAADRLLNNQLEQNPGY